MLKVENNLGWFGSPPISLPLRSLPLPAISPPGLAILLHLIHLVVPSPPLPISSLLPPPSPYSPLPPKVTRCWQFHDCWLIYIFAIMGAHEYLCRWSLAAGHLPIQPAYLMCVWAHHFHDTVCVFTVAFCVFLSHTFQVCTFVSKQWTAGVCDCV